MITRKLAVPLINEKILQQAEHCYIATAGLTEAGFDFIRSRIPAKCRIDLVTGLDRPVSPGVLRRVLTQYSERIEVRIYSRNSFNANLYIFDLPFRKSVAYVGSGSLTMEGLKDQEELFWKITNPKEIESLLSWFTGFYEFGTPLTPELVNVYEPVFESIMAREVESIREKEFALVASSVIWDRVQFRNQFFQRTDYETATDALSIGPSAKTKLHQLQEEVRNEVQRFGLHPVSAALMDAMTGETISSAVAAVWISFSRSSSGFTPGFMRIDAGVTSGFFFIRLFIAGGADAETDRSKFAQRLSDEDFRQRFYTAIAALANDYAIEVAGKSRGIGTIARDAALMEWLNVDKQNRFPVRIERRFKPGDTGIRIDTIRTMLIEEIRRLNDVLSSGLD